MSEVEQLETLVVDDPEAVARAAADRLAGWIRAAVEGRGRCVLALSGGSTPWPTLRKLASRDLPWSRVRVVQVDERLAPAGSPDRNLRALRRILVEEGPLAAPLLHPMPVDAAERHGPATAARRYARELQQLAGHPPRLDVVHLGLGDDGHTASLVPGDPALREEDADVAVTDDYGGHRRMTLTFPALNRARRILWLVTGADKADAVSRLRRGDAEIPASRVGRARALLVCDRAAADGSSGDRCSESHA